MHRVDDDILNDLIKHGASPSDIKEAFITILSDLFENKDNLREFAMTNDFSKW